MLINLSNHPSVTWKAVQLNTARKRYGSVLDLPFPRIHPLWNSMQVQELAAQYVQRCLDLFCEDQHEHAVHIAGEMTFTHAFVPLMQEKGIDCIASTSERLVNRLDDGKKAITFSFVKFRKYPAFL